MATRERAYWLPALAAGGVALLARLVLNLVFWQRFGAQATGGIEVWFYADPGQWRASLLAGDPTALVLATAARWPWGEALHAVIVAGWLLVAAAVAVLCFAARDLYLLSSTVVPSHGEGTDRERDARRYGLAAGILFGATVDNLSYNLATFTHDLMAYLLAAGLLWGMASLGLGLAHPRRNAAKHSWRRLAPATLLAALCYLLGARVGPFVHVVALAGAVGVALVLLAGRRPVGSRRQWLLIGLPVVLLILLAGLAVLAGDAMRSWVAEQALVTRGIDVTAQLAAGSADLMPRSARNLLTSYNYQLWLLPVALILVWRRPQPVGVLLVALGVAGILVFSRASRHLDLGLALVLAVPFVAYHRLRIKVWLGAAVIGYLLTVIYLLVRISHDDAESADNFARIAALFTWLFQEPGGRAMWKILALHLVGGLFVLGPLMVASRWPGRARYNLGAGLAGVMLAGMLPLLFWPAVRSTQQEWAVLRELADSAPVAGTRVLCPWQDGFMVQAVSGLTAVSNPERIDRRTTMIYWCHEATAAAACRAEEISHVYWSADSFTAELRANARGEAVVTRLATAGLFYEDSGWSARNRALGGDPNFPFVTVSLMAQPPPVLAEALPSFSLLADRPQTDSGHPPAARIFAVTPDVVEPLPYDLPRPGVPSPAAAVLGR